MRRQDFSRWAPSSKRSVRRVTVWTWRWQRNGGCDFCQGCGRGVFDDHRATISSVVCIAFVILSQVDGSAGRGLRTRIFEKRLSAGCSCPIVPWFRVGVVQGLQWDQSPAKGWERTASHSCWTPVIERVPPHGLAWERGSQHAGLPTIGCGVAKDVAPSSYRALNAHLSESKSAPPTSPKPQPCLWKCQAIACQHFEDAGDLSQGLPAAEPAIAHVSRDTPDIRLPCSGRCRLQRLQQPRKMAAEAAGSCRSRAQQTGRLPQG